MTLFSHLTAIARDTDKLPDQFRYELTPEPTSLFKDGKMRKATKSTLHNFLLDSITSKRDVDAEACVIDGGALLHKVMWPFGASYSKVIDQYINFIN